MRPYRSPAPRITVTAPEYVLACDAVAAKTEALSGCPEAEIIGRRGALRHALVVLLAARPDRPSASLSHRGAEVIRGSSKALVDAGERLNRIPDLRGERPVEATR